MKKNWQIYRSTKVIPTADVQLAVVYNNSPATFINLSYAFLKTSKDFIK